MPINHDISAQDHRHHERRNYAKCTKNTGRESAQFMTDWVDSRPCCWQVAEGNRGIGEQKMRPSQDCDRDRSWSWSWSGGIIIIPPIPQFLAARRCTNRGAKRGAGVHPVYDRLGGFPPCVLREPSGLEQGGGGLPGLPGVAGAEPARVQAPAGLDDSEPESWGGWHSSEAGSEGSDV